jgi:uncharacterized coiled-coil DUF342 family protein
MTQTIEVNLIDVLNRLETKIDSLDKKIDTKFDYLDKKIDTEVNSLNNKIDNLNNKIDAKFDYLDKKFDAKFDYSDKKIDKLSEEFKEIKVDIATLKEGQNGMSKRLDNNETRLNILISVMFTGLLGIIAKLVFIK